MIGVFIFELEKLFNSVNIKDDFYFKKSKNSRDNLTLSLPSFKFWESFDFKEKEFSANFSKCLDPKFDKLEL